MEKRHFTYFMEKRHFTVFTGRERRHLPYLQVGKGGIYHILAVKVVIFHISGKSGRFPVRISVNLVKVAVYLPDSAEEIGLLTTFSYR